MMATRQPIIGMYSSYRYGYNLTVKLENRPGTLASLGEAMGQAGVNIDGICGVPCEGTAIIHLLVQDPSHAMQVLNEAGFEVEEQRQVLLVDITDQPGELGGIARRLADSNLNIELLYLTAGMDLVIGVEPLEQAAEVLGYTR